MTDDFSPIYIGDTGAPLAPQFLHADGTPMNLSGATISMKMLDLDNPGNIKTCAGVWTIDDATNGKAHYQYQPAEVSQAATWWLFITITIAGQPLHADPKQLEIKYAP